MNALQPTSPPPSAAAAAADVAWLRRGLIAEAIEGLIRQADAAAWFIERGDDEPAERALGRAFDFARRAAAAMRELRGRPEIGGGG